VKPKAAALKVYGTSSVATTVAAVPTGASATGVTLIVIVRATSSRLSPPLDVPPVSRTWNVKLA
jgi:hypothetical protein